MKFKGIIFDMDGVLRIGDHPMPNVNKILELLKENKCPYMISTNECRYTEKDLRDNLEELGISVTPECCIYTSGMAVRDYLEEKITKNIQKNYSIGIIGEVGLFETINELSKYDNFKICDIPPKYDTHLILIIGTLNKIKISNLEKGLKWIKAGAKIIKTCGDTTDPSSKGDYNLGMPSHILHLLEYNIKVPRTYSLGKPHPIHLKKIKSIFPDTNNRELLFVGDTLSTDIQLAEESDMTSCLVLSGNTKRETLKNFIIEPDYIIDSIKNLKDIII